MPDIINKWGGQSGMQKVEVSSANGKQPVNTSVIIAIVKSMEGPPLNQTIPV